MEAPEQLAVAALEKKLQELNKEVGWRTAMAEIMKLSVEHKEQLPTDFKDAILTYYRRGFPGA